MTPVFTDRYGTELRVGGEATFAGCARLMVTRTCGIHVESADFPALIGALYEAAGLPAPVVLERPGVPQGTSPLRYGDFGMRMHKGGIAFSLPGVEARAISPAAARELAAHIAAYADEADREPDAAEAEELTGFLVAAGAGLRTTGVDDIARAALRWMRDKRLEQRQGGGRDA
jgi:hypothetical protein